jgi:hypothetical protein
LAAGTNNPVGGIAEANFPKMLTQVVRNLFPDVPETHFLQIAD